MSFVDLKRKLYDEQFDRIIRDQKMYDYYMGNEDEIFAYLETALRKSFDPNAIGWYQLNYLNITEKIINSLAIVYKEPAVRKLVHPTLNSDSSEVKAVNEYYQKIQPINVNTTDKTANRYGRLWGKTLQQLSFNKYDKRFQYQNSLNHQIVVDPLDDDPFKKETLMYLKDINDEEMTIVWTDDNHFMINSKDQIIPVGNNERMKNPWGVIPFPELALKQSDEDYWGHGVYDIINANEQLNVLMTFFKNVGLFLASQGVLFGTNCQVDKKGRVNDIDGKRKITLDLQHPLFVDNARADGTTPPDLKFVQPQAHIVEIRETIDWEIKRIAQLKGLNPNTILSQIKDTSDYQKMMDAVEQIENRRDDIEPCRIFEKDRFETLRTMNNVLAGTREGRLMGLKPIPEEYELEIDIADIELMKTPEDELKEFETEFKHNLTTPAKYLMDKNPDLSEEEAIKIIENNREYNKSLNGSSITDLFNRREVVNE